MTTTAQLEYDEEKFTELLLYLAEKCKSDRWFGAVKLHKLLYYSEQRAYRELGQPITGAAFQNLEHGPAARRLLPVQNRLLSAGYATIEREPTPTGIQKRLVAKREADLSQFSLDELRIIDSVVEEYFGKTATEISHESHEEPGWLGTSEGEAIPYEMMLLSRPLPTKDDERIALGMVERHNALSGH